MGRFLLVTIQVDMHDQLALTLQDDLTAHRQRPLAASSSTSRRSSRRFLHRPDDRNIAAMSRVLDAQTVVVGHAAGGRDHAGRARAASRASARRSTSSAAWRSSGDRAHDGRSR
jgi:hypothetical protein